MIHQRESLSLSGVTSLLFALGGEKDGEELKVCEKYSLDLNKWSRLPPLNAARTRPIVLNTKRAFCFCGTEL